MNPPCRPPRSFASSSCWRTAVGALTLAAPMACAHRDALKMPSVNSPAMSNLEASRERARLRARVGQVEASLAAVEAKLAAVQAVVRSGQARAAGAPLPQPALQVEQWTPPANADIGHIFGRGEDLKVSRVHVGEDGPR